MQKGMMIVVASIYPADNFHRASRACMLVEQTLHTPTFLFNLLDSFIGGGDCKYRAVRQVMKVSPFTNKTGIGLRDYSSFLVFRLRKC